MTRTIGYLDTLPKAPAPSKPKIDDYQVTYLNIPFEKAWEAAERIAKNKDLTKEAKRRDIDALFADAKDDIEQRHKSAVEDYAAEKTKLELTARRDITPSADEVAQLNYVRDMLENARHDERQLMELWQQALDKGDKVTARVMLDFGETLVRNTRDARFRNAGPSTQFKDLAAKTDDVLATDEQRKARQRLTVIEPTITAITMAKNSALGKMRGWVINHEGTLLDGYTAQQRDQFRRNHL